MARATHEQAAAKKFITAVSTLDFDAEDFAMTVICQSTVVQNRVLELMMTVVDSIVIDLGTGAFPTDPEKVNLFMKAKQIQDAMAAFR